MKIKLTNWALIVAATLWSIAAVSAIEPDSRRPQESLDEFSTLLTILRTDEGFELHWYPSSGLNYWAVTFSANAQMTNLDTLAVTADTFYVLRDAEGTYTLGFFRVDPIDLEPPADTVIAVESFENNPSLQSLGGEDLEPAAFELTDADHVGESGHALRMYGNTWKRIAIPPTQIDTTTVWAIWAKLLTRGEVQAIGVGDSANYLYYILWGKEAPQSLNWNTVYEGWFAAGEWQNVELPIGEDWEGRFGYSPRLTDIRFINDNDTVAVDGEVLFDDLRDVTGAQAPAPVAAFDWTVVEDGDPDSITVVFHSHSYDVDSPWLTHEWNFGDGSTSSVNHPVHKFRSQSRHPVTLTVTDSERNDSWVAHAVVDSPITAPRDLWFAFAGDVITGRGYENNNGIIESWGIDTLFEPCYSVLSTSDLTSLNLECPMTTATTAHPTKGIVFKSNPANVSGLVSAGVDFVTLANNHVFDYMIDGMTETMYVLDTAGIVHNGSGMNDELARRVRFLSSNGLSIAMLSFSDRTGSYNNVQPFLDAGRSRPGFAMWNRGAIEATVDEAEALADFVVINTHSGSEYSLAPILQMQAEQDPFGDEDMLFELVPDTLERQIRQYAIDRGADLVIAHHPHIIQGFEVYDGKLIAHSLGNFIFDLTYAETMPTVILRTHFSAGIGVDSAIVYPVYINHWIPQLTHGELARNLLDYESEMSRRLGTWLVRPPDADSALIIFDTTGVFRSLSFELDTLALSQDGTWWISAPHKLIANGYPTSAEIVEGAGYQIRFGREKLYYGNMEDEGSNEWLLNSADEGYVTDVVHSGSRSIRLRRTSGTPGNVVSNIEYRLPISTSQEYSVVGWMSTQNAGTTSLQAQYYGQRSGGTALGLADIGGTMVGTSGWVLKHAPLLLPPSTTFISVRVSLLAPAIGTGYSWFDDVALVEWGAWQDAPAISGFPKDFHFVQVRTTTNTTQATLSYVRQWVDVDQPVMPSSAAVD
ncbi:MAG: CapA family protein [bacterium]|nr:CapA family protein [bacterium]